MTIEVYTASGPYFAVIETIGTIHRSHGGNESMKVQKDTSALLKVSDDRRKARTSPLQPVVDASVEETKSQGRVEVATSRFIRDELSPEKIAAERDERVRRIAALVQSGSYFDQQSPADRARAIRDGIDSEVSLLQLLTAEE